MPFVAGETVLIRGATTSRCTASARRSNKEAGLLRPQPEGRREFGPISLSLVVDDATTSPPPRFATSAQRLKVPSANDMLFLGQDTSFDRLITFGRAKAVKNGRTEHTDTHS